MGKTVLRKPRSQVAHGFASSLLVLTFWRVSARPAVASRRYFCARALTLSFHRCCSRNSSKGSYHRRSKHDGNAAATSTNKGNPSTRYRLGTCGWPARPPRTRYHLCVTCLVQDVPSAGVASQRRMGTPILHWKPYLWRYLKTSFHTPVPGKFS